MAETIGRETRAGRLLRWWRRRFQSPTEPFDTVCRELIDANGGPALRAHLYRDDPGHEQESEQRVVADLTLLVLHPAEDELTAEMRRVVVVAAALGDHPVARIAQRKILAAGDQTLVDEVYELADHVPRLADFCREHELTPSEPARRTVFWLLTGEYDRYRRADPYGAAAAAAYAAADSDGRARMRSAAIDGGLFEFLRRMVEDPAEFADLLRGEQFLELSAGLARHERWSLLWELLAEVPTATAVERSRLFPADWRPATPEARRRLADLRSAQN
ncbi:MULTISPECIES: hypothetical protein [unclassified Kribbella]|uniref:hypothetical protein n=1 Tax=unclassified Kribbella TaxID=2644121 RepID=UPI0033F26E73